MKKIQCPHCATKYNVPESMAGKKVRCRKCGKIVRIPQKLQSDNEKEVSEGGSVIHRHQERKGGFKFASGDSENIERISNHIERHIGTPDSVFHELVSDLVHIDIHIVQPTEERPFYTLVTSGMSDQRMSPPGEVAHLGYAELCLSLPADWPVGNEAFNDDEFYWPVYWLKKLARFPHEYNTWIFDGHTIPNGDPPEKMHPSVGFSSWLVTFPILVPEPFLELKVNANKSIFFLAIVPLFESELNYKLKKGHEQLLKRLDKKRVTEVVDIDRKPVTKGLWPFG